VNQVGTTLLPGERLSWAVEDVGDVAASTDKAIDEKYARGEVRIVTEQGRYPLNTISALVESTNYNLQPEFQRRHRWDRVRQSRLIESFIMNVPVPPIFLYEISYSQYEVMDGLQRLTAIKEFYADEFALKGLEEWTELNGRTYSRLPDQVRRGIDRRYLSSVVLLYETAKDTIEADRLKQLVFERINSGGEDLSPQETRNALYPGGMNRLCVDLAQNEFYCRLWGIPLTKQTAANEPVPKELAENPMFQRMLDVEYVLRFFAHRQRRDLWKSGTRLDNYLTRYLRDANSYPTELLTGLRAIFEETVKLVWDVLGERAFWLWRDRQGKRGWVDRPTLIAYDAVMLSFSQYLGDQEELRRRKKEIVAALPSFYDEHYDDFDGRKTNATDIARRDSAMSMFLAKLIQG
jgi:hypothetical protein